MAWRHFVGEDTLEVAHTHGDPGGQILNRKAPDFFVAAFFFASFARSTSTLRCSLARGIRMTFMFYSAA